MATGADNFNRADGALSGSTASDGVNTWSVTGGSWAIFTNRLEWNAPGSVDFVAWMSSLPNCATQTVSAVFNESDVGVVARYNVTSGIGTFYMVWASSGAYNTSGISATYTRLGSTPTTLTLVTATAGTYTSSGGKMRGLYVMGNNNADFQNANTRVYLADFAVSTGGMP